MTQVISLTLTITMFISCGSCAPQWTHDMQLRGAHTVDVGNSADLLAKNWANALPAKAVLDRTQQDILPELTSTGASEQLKSSMTGDISKISESVSDTAGFPALKISSLSDTAPGRFIHATAALPTISGNNNVEATPVMAAITPGTNMPPINVEDIFKISSVITNMIKTFATTLQVMTKDIPNVSIPANIPTDGGSKFINLPTSIINSVQELPKPSDISNGNIPDINTASIAKITQQSTPSKTPENENISNMPFDLSSLPIPEEILNKIKTGELDVTQLSQFPITDNLKDLNLAQIAMKPEYITHFMTMMS